MPATVPFLECKSYVIVGIYTSAELPFKVQNYLRRASAFCDCQIAAVYHLATFTFTFTQHVHSYLSTAAFSSILRTLSLSHSKHYGSESFVACLMIFTFTFSDCVDIYFSAATFAVRFRRINVSLDYRNINITMLRAY